MTPRRIRGLPTGLGGRRRRLTAALALIPTALPRRGLQTAASAKTPINAEHLLACHVVEHVVVNHVSAFCRVVFWR